MRVACIPSCGQCSKAVVGVLFCFVLQNSHLHEFVSILHLRGRLCNENQHASLEFFFLTMFYFIVLFVYIDLYIGNIAWTD